MRKIFLAFIFLVAFSHASAQPTANASGLDWAKKKCVDLGFKTGTERFGNCVLQLTRDGVGNQLNPLEKSKPDDANNKIDNYKNEFIQIKSGKWSRDNCKTIASYFEEKNGIFLGESFNTNGSSMARYEIDLSSLRYIGESSGLKKFEFNLQTIYSNGTRTELRVIEEGNSSGRRVLESENLSNHLFYVKDGYLIANKIPFPNEVKCAN